MPPKKYEDEEVQKLFDKSIRPLLFSRGLLWRGGKVGVFDEEMRSFLVSKDEFLPNDEVRPSAAVLGARYLGIAQNPLTRPQLVWLRKKCAAKADFELPAELQPVFLPVLAALGALFVCWKHTGKASERPLRDWEAMLSSTDEELRAATASTLGKFRSPIAALETKETKEVKDTKEDGSSGGKRDREKEREEERKKATKQRQQGACWNCGGLGHRKYECPFPQEVEEVEVSGKSSTKKPVMKKPKKEIKKDDSSESE